jgi:hypothetical protein
MTAKMQKLMLTREADVVELERQRTLRQSQERADEALEAAQRSQHLLQRQEASAAMEAQARAAVATSERSKKGYEDMLEVVRADGEKAAAEIELPRQGRVADVSLPKRADRAASINLRVVVKHEDDP